MSILKYVLHNVEGNDCQLHRMDNAKLWIKSLDGKMGLKLHHIVSKLQGYIEVFANSQSLLEVYRVLQ